MSNVRPFKKEKLERGPATDKILSYLDTDLLCYRTDQPPELAALQADSWNPWLAWFSDKFDVTLLTTTDLKALNQPEEAHKAVSAYIQDLEDNRLDILHQVVILTGSLVLGLAFIEQALTSDQAYAACHVEEDFKAKIYDEEKYGPDPAQEKKDKALRADLDAAAAYLNALS